MSKYLIAYAGAGCVFLLLDAVWLIYITKNFYKNEIGQLLLENPKFFIAGVFYVVFIFGIVFFAVIPANQDGSVVNALLCGIFLGLLCYGTYELTNYATLKDWSLRVVIVDILWGGFVTGASALGGYYSLKLFFK
tara:strand:+ start:172 stop:576 length:405 start_codon:yes stop_codon:yes gene_type:complete